MAIRPHHHPMHEQPGSKSLQPIWITHDWVSTEHVKKQLTLLLSYQYMYVHYNTMKENGSPVNPLHSLLVLISLV